MQYVEFLSNDEPVLIPLENIATVVPGIERAVGRDFWNQKGPQNLPKGSTATIHFKAAADGKTSVRVDQSYAVVKEVLRQAGHELISAPIPSSRP